MNRRDVLDRFWEKVEKSDGCWLWLGAKNKLGYGSFGAGSLGSNAAHRFAYEALVGPIPEGLELDHLCRNPSCVNPSHLDPVTHHENILRGNAPPAINARKTHCKRGHEFTPDNTYTLKSSDGRDLRDCRTCRNEAQRKLRNRTLNKARTEAHRVAIRKLRAAHPEEWEALYKAEKQARGLERV